MTKILRHSRHLHIEWYYGAVVTTTEQPLSIMLGLIQVKLNCSATVEIIIIIIILS